MANTTLLSVRILDDAGKAGTVNVFLPAAATIAELQAYSDDFVAALDAITGAKVDAATVALNLTLPGALKAAALADHFLQAGSLWSYDAANTPYRHSIFVPAIDHGLVVGGVIDTAPAFVTTWNGILVTGDGTLSPQDKYGNDLTAFLSAVLSFRKY